MSFDGIKGQDRAVSFLKGSISGGRIAHAYIFYGARGVGKKLSALEFAKAVNCASPGERPCRLCPSCAKIGSSSHPDVSVITPAAGSQSLGIDGIRSLISDISLKPYEARKKIYIIDEADSLTEEASNALLKTLEEPPTDSVIILIAEKLQHILPTIISRSQTVRFFALAAETVERILVKDRGLEAGAASEKNLTVWLRDIIVGRICCSFSAISIITESVGGSSSVFNSAFDASSVRLSASSIM